MGAVVAKTTAVKASRSLENDFISTRYLEVYAPLAGGKTTQPVDADGVRYGKSEGGRVLRDNAVRQLVGIDWQRLAT